MAVPVDLPLIGSRGQAIRADRVASQFVAADFERRSCGHGTKGERYYNWAAVTVTVKDQDPAEFLDAGGDLALSRIAEMITMLGEIERIHPEGQGRGEGPDGEVVTGTVELSGNDN